MTSLKSECLDDWERVGRGMELQFFATDGEVEGFLASGLPAAYAPYSLIGVDRIEKAKGEYEDRVFEFGVETLRTRMQGPSGIRRWQFWIWGSGLLPSREFREWDRVGALCAINGLVLLQHGAMRKGLRDASRVAVVDKIRNSTTREVRRHEEGIAIFRGLVSLIKPALRFASVQKCRDGHEEEDTTVQLMTEGAAAESARVQLSRRCGRRLS